MASDGQIVFEITADGKKAVASLQDVTRAIETETKKWDVSAGNASKNMESSFTAAIGKIGAAMGAAKIGQLLMDFGKQAIDTASDLREVQNVVDVTFGEGAAQIETWAKSAASNFGLTETQAKKFTSTLGAMMKSSGLAGDEIIGMSTDLSGLAADMASFYNLDFDTAFQKIRAGISGETEPLKQLGINMSVANLEAYALTQGITKSFDKMSQGEQIMLRYQYLMQATADAQGDFARTADGFANAQRRIETAITQIKTSVGTMLLDVVEPLTSGLAGFLEKLTAVPETTVIDEFKKIDSDTQAKMAEVTKAADDARALIGVLQSIQSEKVENASLTSFVTSLTKDLGNLDGAMKAAKDGDYQGTISGIASAMAVKTGTDAKQWDTLLTAISSKLPAAAKAAGDGKDKTEAFLTAAGQAAAELGGEYPALWATFMATLGSENTKNALDYMAKGQAAADAMYNIGIEAGGLDGTEKDKWSGLLGVLATASPTKGLFGNDAESAATNIGKLASALSSNDPAKKQQAWSDMLGVLTENIGGVAELAKQSPDDTKKWLEGLAKSAGEIDQNDPKAWDGLFDALLKGLSGLEDDEIGQAFLNNLKTLATNSNTLNAQSGKNWSSLLTALNEADTTKGIFGADAASRITGLSEALASSNPTAKKKAWDEMLGVLSSNADAVSKLTNKSPEELKKFFTELSESAPETDEDLGKWNELLTSLASAFTGLDKEGLGENFIESLEKLGTGVDGNAFFAALSAGFMGLGQETTEAERALRALGVDTSGVADKQALWLKTCEKLVKTIPGLSEVINTETGEIKGGIPAIKAYVDEYENANKKMIAMQALQKKEEALAAKRVQMVDYELEYKAAKSALEQFEAEHAELAKTMREQGILGVKDSDDKDKRQYMALLATAKEAKETYEGQAKALDEAEDKMKAYRQAVEGMPGDVDKLTNSTENASEATEQLTEDEKTLQKELKGVTKALEEVEKYYDNAYKGIEKALEGSHELFGTVIDPAQKAKDKIAEVEKSISELTKKSDKDKKAKLQVELTGLKEAQKTITNMNTGLQSQITYYQKYLEMLNKAREMGYSDEVLSSVSDGSQASYEYLQAMTNTGVSTEQVKQLNDGFKQVNEEREKLTKELTEQSLSTDKAFQNLVKSATDAVNGLNLGEEAKSAMEQTVQGLINGIAAKHKDLQTEVDAVNETLSRMGGFGFNFGFGAGGFSLSFGSKGKEGVDGSHALGLDYVPFNHYLAELHEGEGILTAEENKVWQNFKNGGLSTRNTVDYDALGATMRDNVKAGGNVYLDGQTVGRVISASQANAFRSMERSGFQQ